MSDADNLFRGPEAEAVAERPLIAQGGLTEAMMLYLKGASPWLRFMGVIGFIGAGLTVLWGLGSLAIFPMMGQMMADAWEDVPGFEAFGGIFSSVFGGTTAVLSLGSGVVMFFPALFAYRFGEKISTYMRTSADNDLEQAFRNNRSLWKFNGILCIVSLSFIPLLIIVGIIGAMIVSNL